MSSEFLTNYTENTFLEEIRYCLRRCSSFSFSVSFIKKAGLVLLMRDIEAAVDRGATGRIITSTYQNFTDIESLKSLLTLQTSHNNFSCRLDYDSFHDNSYMVIGYHSKGYLFEFNDKTCEVVIGSSNITRPALLSNIEWDMSVRESMPSNLYSKAIAEFEDKWEGTHPLSLEIIRRYAKKLEFAIDRWDLDCDIDDIPSKPNFMQKKALKELNRFRAVGQNKALVIAATGSGKTYLAAFDAYNFNPNKLLYVVHESSILHKSFETFQTIFGAEKSMGIFADGKRELDADFLFATNISIANSLERFDPTEFDYIIIDECHHAVANTYKKIIEYFRPEFLLGLTATPERMDNQDVFDLFDANVPFELRLRDALVNDLVVPFHYYGIRDQLVDYGLSSSEERVLVAQLSTPEHCAFIHEQIELHRPEINGKLKGIVFCRNIQHARMMSENMGEYYHTTFLTGKNDTGSRIRAYTDLQDEFSDLELIFTVDILNEGVDIPGINMVIFLRPTESQTVFIQQLGRGLRKYDNKEYVTVLDFVGNNYKRSVQMVMALGSLSNNFVLESRLLATMVQDDFTALDLYQYGVRIYIDDLSKEELKSFIESENFNQTKYLKQDYKNFKEYINSGSYPKHMDYLNSDCAPNLIRFMSVKLFDNKKNHSYYNFLRGIEETDLPIFSDRQVSFINYLSDMLPIVREYEMMIFSHLIHDITSMEEIRKELSETIAGYSDSAFDHALYFINESGFAADRGDEINLTVDLNPSFVEYVDDLISYGLTRYLTELGDCADEFKLYGNYRMDQVQLKLLKNPGYNQLGTYVYDKTVVIFASLKKNLPDNERTNYKDKFLTPDIFQWECEVNIAKDKLDGLINSSFAHIFIRKISEENGITLPFTYVGKGKLTNPRKLVQHDEIRGKDYITYLFDIPLENSLPYDLQYDFIF